jgi:DNA-binding response OmpR family regulator
MIKPPGHSEDKSRVFRLNEGTREVFSGDRSVKLTKKEFDILQKLVFKPGRVVERDELLAQVWGPEVHVAGRTIDAHIVKLRRKMRCLGEQAPAIETVWALGYRLRG